MLESLVDGGQRVLDAELESVGPLAFGRWRFIGDDVRASRAVLETVLALEENFAVLDKPGVRTIGASNTSLLATVEPFVAALLAFAFLDESLTPVQLVGGAMILTAVVLLSPGEAIAALEPGARPQ